MKFIALAILALLPLTFAKIRPRRIVCKFNELRKKEDLKLFSVNDLADECADELAKTYKRKEKPDIASVAKKLSEKRVHAKAITVVVRGDCDSDESCFNSFKDAKEVKSKDFNMVGFGTAENKIKVAIFIRANRESKNIPTCNADEGYNTKDKKDQKTKLDARKILCLINKKRKDWKEKRDPIAYSDKVSELAAKDLVSELPDLAGKIKDCGVEIKRREKLWKSNCDSEQSCVDYWAKKSEDILFCKDFNVAGVGVDDDSIEILFIEATKGAGKDFPDKC